MSSANDNVRAYFIN